MFCRAVFVVLAISLSFSTSFKTSIAEAKEAEGNVVLLKKSGSRQARLVAERNNEAQATTFRAFGELAGVSKTVRPFADYEKAGYVFISSSFLFESQTAKEAIAANLPPDVTLVVFMEDTGGSKAKNIRSIFGKYLPPDRLKLLELNDSSDGFWARDGLPVPVIEEVTGALSLVDARYYYPFEPDAEVGELFGATVRSHKFNYEGGNFMANHLGHCIMVDNSSHKKIPNSIFETYYGCKKLERLPFVAGIGHIDEHVRFVSEDTVLTDESSYKTILERSGLKAILLPRPENELETYVNSLIVNGVAVVPVYGQKTDQDALQVYRDAGFKAVSADSSALSNDGEGSVHCITMTYPQVPFAKLLSAIGATEIH